MPDLEDFRTGPLPSPSKKTANRCPPQLVETAKEMHGMMYPIQSTKPEIAEHEMLAVAAAFEGMHHWEHERRQGKWKRG